METVQPLPQWLSSQTKRAEVVTSQLTLLHQEAFLDQVHRVDDGLLNGRGIMLTPIALMAIGRELGAGEAFTHIWGLVAVAMPCGNVQDGTCLEAQDHLSTDFPHRVFPIVELIRGAPMAVDQGEVVELAFHGSSTGHRCPIRRLSKPQIQFRYSG